MPRQHSPNRLQTQSHQSIQENNARYGVRKPAVPVRLETNHTAMQQPVVQGVFIFNGKIVKKHPDEQPPPGWESQYQKIYDAGYEDYVYVPLTDVELYRQAMAEERAQTSPEPATQSGLEGPLEDSVMREKLIDLYHYHNDLPGTDTRRKPSINAFIKTYEKLKKEGAIESITNKELYEAVMANMENDESDSVDNYLLQESEAEEMSLLFPEIKQVSIEEIEALSEKTTKVGEWDKAVPSKNGIYTDEMKPCITVGLTAILPNGDPVSALFHSMRPADQGPYIIQCLQGALGEMYDRLSSIKYFVVGGSHETINKAINILSTLAQMGLNISGVRLTTTIEERHLVKSVIVMPTGEIRYAVSVSPPPTPQPETLFFPSGFGSAPRNSDPSPGQEPASNISSSNETPSFSSVFTSSRALLNQTGEGPGTQSQPGFSTSFRVSRPPGGSSSGFRPPRQQARPPAPTDPTPVPKPQKEENKKDQ